MITRENKIIRLSWAKADLFQTICTETAYNARTLADDKGLPLFDRYAITADERAFFDQYIAEALTTLSHHFRRIVPDSQPMAVEGDTCGLTFTARLADDGRELYGLSELDAVDHSATNVLCYLIVSEWYLSVQASDLWKTYLQKLAIATAELSTLLFRFYRPALKQSFMVAPDPSEAPPKDYEINIDAGTIKQYGTIRNITVPRRTDRNRGTRFPPGDLAGGRRMVRNDSSSYHRLFHRHPQGACSQNPEGQPRVPAVVREIRRLRKSYRDVNAI